MLSAAEVIRNLDHIDLEITVPETRLNDAKTQIDLLHRDDDGQITISVKDGTSWIQYHYKVEELKKYIGKVLNLSGVKVYISPNSFYKPFRKIENVRKLNSLYIDLDYYNLGEYTTEQIIWILENDYFKKSVPDPNFIVSTGRGIAIYWLIEAVPYKALPLWNAVQKYLLSQLKDIGADEKSIDAARVMRLAGSINQKSGNLAELHLYNSDCLYSLRDIQDQYLPELSPFIDKPYAKRKGRKPKVVNFYTLYSLHYARLRDVVKLQELRKGYCRTKEGTLNISDQREFMCFLYRYWSCCYESNKKRALENTLEFNKGFAEPLSESGVITATRSAEKAYEKWLEDSPSGIYKRGGYNYKNETLIEKLYITQEEMKELETIINDVEVKRRNNNRTKEAKKLKARNENGLTTREQSKQDNINNIKLLREDGYKLGEIAQKLNLSISTVSKSKNCEKKNFAVLFLSYLIIGKVTLIVVP